MDETRQTGWLARNWGCLVPVALVIFILMVIVPQIGLIPPHGTDQSAKAATTRSQWALAGAIDACRKVTGSVPDVVYDPDSGDPNKSDPARQMALLVAKLRGKDRDDPVYKATKPFLGDDPERSTRDGYGNAMLYVKDGGMGGKPVIISAGPDGKFGYETEYKTNPAMQKQHKKDNIRSDMH